MPRANRHHLPGYIWHITHRCHKREFLLKFSKDKQCWIKWLFEAKRRFGLCILDYMVTSNHIHLLVFDDAEELIPKSIQLIAGRTGQEYNKRKKRKGAFWEDRYHATAVENDRHLIQCLVYIDLNMVRAGVVEHPSRWSFCGYNEIQRPKERYAIINRHKLMNMLGIQDNDDLIIAHRKWVEEFLKNNKNVREAKWTESVAIGSKEFVEATQEKLGIRAKGRRVVEENGIYELKESQSSYGNVFSTEKRSLRPKNTYFWSEYSKNSIG